MFSRDRMPARADARRNREAIIEAAITALDERPGASVGEIAAAAGVSRATVYGNFPNRRALVAAAIRMLAVDLDRRLTDIDPGLPARDALEQLVHGSWRALGRIPGLAAAARTEVGNPDPRELLAGLHLSIRAMLLRGREDGVFRRDQDLGWQVACLYAVLRAGASEIRVRGRSQPTATTDVVTTIRALLAAAPEGSAGGTAQPRAPSTGPP